VSELIQFDTSAGEASGYLARPADGAPQAGVVVGRADAEATRIPATLAGTGGGMP